MAECYRWLWGLCFDESEKKIALTSCSQYSPVRGPETCWCAGAFGDVTGSRWPTRQGGCLLPRSGSGGWSSPGGRSVGAIWQVFLLLVEDIFEEVDVVAEEEQGKLSL